MNFEMKVIKELGTLSDRSGHTKAVKLVSWNNSKPVIDVRTWDKSTGHPLRGVTIKLEEVPALVEILKGYLDTVSN